MRLRLKRVRSASPRPSNATTVRYPERVSFSSSPSASARVLEGNSARWALKECSWPESAPRDSPARACSGSATST